MDVQTIDQTYNQLQTQAQQSAQALQTLGNKLQAAASSGDMQAREWLLDLRELALSFQAEQQQVTTLLQTLHTTCMQQIAPAAPETQAQPAPTPQQSDGFFSDLLRSSFGQAIASGAGFGIGDDLVKKIF
ncbi:hypothetical protein [Acetobacter fallax]|uniref:Uncharacterized protein n=1 Tax=Acetobacter fallax TaxID=1737473 RepID=A0ABX0KC10_9PROT|nr:hypothetical protein [Acetobacter fallax]NHO32718.1 hypothetical protein [Acetobacter fallax]NHO36222.1 hypothetical protein [Acetobacter fallax]